MEKHATDSQLISFASQPSMLYGHSSTLALYILSKCCWDDGINVVMIYLKLFIGIDLLITVKHTPGY